MERAGIGQTQMVGIGENQYWLETILRIAHLAFRATLAVAKNGIASCSVDKAVKGHLPRTIKATKAELGRPPPR